MNIVQVPVPKLNFNTGRAIYKPKAVVIHLMDGSLEGTDAWFCNPASRVSAHYGIGTSGEIHQYVREENTAYHVGVVHNPTWSALIKGINPNFYTIGIEHEGLAGASFTPEQQTASQQLCADICSRWVIPIDALHIIGHHEIYDMHNCPGPGWDKNAYIQGVLDVK